MNSYIYEIMEKSRLRELLEAFHGCLKLSIQILDENGHVLEQCGSEYSYCSYFVSCMNDENICRHLHAAAGRRAVNLGEAYIFSCHSGLCHIVFPLVNKGTLFGSVLVGPFLMTDPDSSMILDLGKRYPTLTTEQLMELYDDSRNIPLIDPPTVTQVSRLLYCLFSHFLSDAKEQFIINQSKLHQQAKISESIRMYKEQTAATSEQEYIQLEQELLSKVRTGDLTASRAILNDLLGYVFFSGRSNTEYVKTRCIELCSLLSRIVIESGTSDTHILTMNDAFIRNLQSYNSTEDLCYTLDEILKIFMDSMFPSANTRNHQAVRTAMNYISAHFHEPLTLETISAYVGLNPAYFSSLFHEVSGHTFKEYLTSVRIEEAKRLLQNTDYSLLDIAVASGFESQSYFSKVFRKMTGIPPKACRALNGNRE